MKTAVIALCALIVAAPAVLAQNVSSKTLDHHASKHPRIVSGGHAPRHAMRAKGTPGAFGYAPSEPKDYTYDISRSAGGGGGGGGGSGM
jgi:hypothetical protein